MSNSIITYVDDSGKVNIPGELKDAINLKKQDRFAFYVNKNKEGKKDLILKKLENTCVFCDSKSNLVDFKGYYICADCVKSLLKDA